MNTLDFNRVTIIYIDKQIVLEGVSSTAVIANINGNDTPQSFKIVYTNIYNFLENNYVIDSKPSLLVRLNEIYGVYYHIVDIVPFTDEYTPDIKEINKVKKSYTDKYNYLIDYPVYKPNVFNKCNDKIYLFYYCNRNF